MYKSLFALLYLPLSLLAQTTQPSHCLAGFLYAKLLAPTGLEWQNPESYALNKEQPRADFHSFATRSTALGVLPEYSEYYRSLDGRWHFHRARNPEERPKDFHHPNFDVSRFHYPVQRWGKFRLKIWNGVLYPSFFLGLWFNLSCVLLQSAWETLAKEHPFGRYCRMSLFACSRCGLSVER